MILLIKHASLGTAYHRTDARPAFIEWKGLDQVVVSAGVQTRNAPITPPTQE